MVKRLANWNDYYKSIEERNITNIIRIDPQTIYSSTPCIGCREPRSDSAIEKQMNIINNSRDKYIKLYVDSNKGTKYLTAQRYTESVVFIRLKAIMVVDQSKDKVQIRDSFSPDSWYKVDEFTLKYIIDELKEEGLWTVENSMQ